MRYLDLEIGQLININCNADEEDERQPREIKREEYKQPHAQKDEDQIAKRRRENLEVQYYNGIWKSEKR